MRRINPAKALAGLIDWGVFFVASAMLFLKTAEVMTKFAPSEILGYQNVGPLYGMTSALLVEGVLILAKLSTRYAENGSAWLWNVGLIALTWTISAGAQIVDGFIVAGTLDQQPAVVAFVVRAGIPLIPSIVLMAVLIKGVLATLPNEEAPKPQILSRDKRLLSRDNKAANLVNQLNEVRPAYASETDGRPNLKAGAK